MELGQLGPHMGYRWVRADPRITPGWTHPGNSGSGTGKSGKTGKSVSRPFCLIAAEPPAPFKRRSEKLPASSNDTPEIC